MHRLMSVGIVLLGWFVASIAGAQERDDGLAGRGPRFFRATADSPVPVDVRRTPMLLQRISVDLDGVTLKEALAEISRRANLPLMYSRDVIPLDSRVRLRAENITVAGALSEVLVDAGVDVLLSGGRAALVKRTVAVTPPRQPGSVTGRVGDAKTGQGLAAADVVLEGTGRRTATDAEGRYRLVDVAPGSYALVVRRIGYVRQRQPVTVVDGQEVAVDVALEPMPTQLNELVTTVTGEQRRLELGHVVGRINADSVVREAPVSNLSELLTARVPGLQVFQSAGTVGGEVRLQVRGPNSFLLSTEPIVILDGVRYTNGAAQGLANFPTTVERTSPLNDINPNDIETIEVVKGPSAATLYGTDAANGVIVITTKRGRPGPARWNAYVRGSTTLIPEQRYPDRYWGWGTSSTGTPNVRCIPDMTVQGQCTQDSVQVLPNPLNDPALTIFGSEPRWNYGVNVAGGRQDVRYYFSGDYERAVGPVRMPEVIAEEVKKRQGVSELSDEQLRPNALSKVNLRTNVTALLGETADLRATAGYVHNAIRSLGVSIRSPYEWGVAEAGPTTPYAPTAGNPAASFLQPSTEAADRFFVGLDGQWRPMPWLVTRATVGLDLTSRNRYSLARRGQVPSDGFANAGYVGDERVRQTATTADLRATATLRRGRLTARTSVGAQYARNLDDALSVIGRDMPPGGTSIGEAATIFSRRQTYRETVTLGSYVEETLGLNERLFLTGALRMDGASAFGHDYEATIYPKAGVSWLVSDEPFLPRIPGLDELRLRYSFGASGQQPQPGWALPAFRADPAFVDGATLTSVGVNGLGNPELQPQRMQEHELGFDATALDNRVQVGLTWYRRRTVDQIVSVALPPGFGSTFMNFGLTTQHGFEAELRARVLDTRLLSFDVMAHHALHRTRLDDLGGAIARYALEGGWVEGYPLGARFHRPLLGWADANGDGIITRAEVQVGETPLYAGESTPPISQTLTAALGFFDRRLRLSALVERRSGFVQLDQLKRTLCIADRCRARVDPGTPLAEQAALVATRLGTNGNHDYYLAPGDFTRLREVTVALDLPAHIARALRVRSASIAVTGRNLALWTDFPGPDPESAAVSGVIGGGAAGIPQGRSWSLRLDLGL